MLISTHINYHTLTDRHLQLFTHKHLILTPLWITVDLVLAYQQTLHDAFYNYMLSGYTCEVGYFYSLVK